MDDRPMPRISDEQANAFAVGEAWPLNDVTMAMALVWLAADLLDARHEADRLQGEEAEDLAQEREYRRVVEIESGQLRTAARDFLADAVRAHPGMAMWRTAEALGKEL